MIKKINIALASVFAVVLLVSAVRGMLSDKKTETGEMHVESTPVAEKPPKVNVYYVGWTKFAKENRISNRNGVLLDLMRAIFPESKAHYLVGNAKKFADKMAEDPAAVVVGFGDHPELKSCRRAPTPLAMASLVVCTLRSNPWRFDGSESLDRLRLIVRSSLLDYAVLRERAERHSGDSDKMLIVDSSMSLGDITALIESGKADGFCVATGESLRGSRDVMSAPILQRFRISEVVANDPVYLYVSSVNPAFADAVVDAYESGIRRIDASGERARIFVYYDMTPESLPARSR